MTVFLFFSQKTNAQKEDSTFLALEEVYVLRFRIDTLLSVAPYKCLLKTKQAGLYHGTIDSIIVQRDTITFTEKELIGTKKIVLDMSLIQLIKTGWHYGVFANIPCNNSIILTRLLPASGTRIYYDEIHTMIGPVRCYTNKKRNREIKNPFCATEN